MNRNKQLAINMIAKIFVFVINVGIGFFLTPFIVKHVGREAYGFVGLANNFINYAKIITTALNSMAGRFITISIHRKEYEETNKFFTSVIVANIVVSSVLTVVAVLVLIFLDKIINVPQNILSDVTILWALLFANFLIGLVGNVLNVATFVRNKLYLTSLRTIESDIIRVTILVCAFAFFEPRVWYLGISTLVCGLYVIIINFYYTKKLLPTVRVEKKYFDLNKIKMLVMSGVWNSLTKISGILSTGLDLLITNLFVGASAMGTVSISKTIPAEILSVFGLIASVFAPQLTISYAKNDFDDIKKQLNSAMRLLGFFACIPMAFLYIYGKEFYSLWMPDQDASTLHLLSLLCSGALVFCLPLEPLWNIFTVTNKVKQSSLFLLLNSALSTLIVFILLRHTTDEIMKMCIVVGVSTVMSIIRALTFLPMYGAVCLGFKWYTFFPIIFRNAVSVAIVSALALVIKILIPINGWIILLLDIALMGICACIINYFLMLGKDEREILKNKIFRREQKV